MVAPTPGGKLSSGAQAQADGFRRMGRGVDGIAEVVVEWKADGRSRVNPLQDMWKVVTEAITIRKNLTAGVYDSARARPASAT